MQLDFHRRENEVGPYLIPHKNFTQNCQRPKYNSLNYKQKKNSRIDLYNPGFGNGFIDVTFKA